MKAQVWEILAIRCGFFVPNTVFAGGGKRAYLVNIYQQVNREYLSLPFRGR